jgi:ribose-phosphate pyrophosphokinase
LGRASERLAAVSQIKEIVTTDTVPLPMERRPPNLTTLSTAPIFGGAIRQNYYRQSIGLLFDFGQDGE